MQSLSQKIYNYLLTIPKGKVVTYKHIANKFKTHPRAVGKILNSNKDPDKYPCYKIVGFDGRLTGYALGLDKKIELLENDGIQIINGKVLSKYILY